MFYTFNVLSVNIYMYIFFFLFNTKFGLGWFVCVVNSSTHNPTYNLGLELITTPSIYFFRLDCYFRVSLIGLVWVRRVGRVFVHPYKYINFGSTIYIKYINISYIRHIETDILFKFLSFRCHLI